MRACFKALLLVLGFIETLLFSGAIFGWADIVYVLKKVEIYNCPEDENDTTMSNSTCVHQDNMFNIAFTIGATTTGACGLITAWILDNLGLKMSRLIANLVLLIGGLLLSLTGDWHHALIPGTFFLGFGGGQTYRNNILIANLFPQRRSTVIALYSGAFLASASMGLGLKYTYDNGFRFRNTMLTWTGMTLLMLMTTLFLPTPLLPRARRTRKLNKKQKDTYHLLPVKADEDTSEDENGIEKDHDGGIRKPLSFVRTSCSGSFLIHTFWMCIMNLLMLEYNGSFNRWLHQASTHVNTNILWKNYTIHISTDTFETMLEDTANNESWMSTLYGCSQVAMLVIAPLAGLLMDYSWKKSRAVDVLQILFPDPDPAKLQSKSHRSGFFVLFVTTFLATLLNICFFYPSNFSIKISLVLFVIVRAFSYAAGFSYIRSRFPQELFNRLTGLMTTWMSIIGLLQVPIFMASSTNPVLVHSLMTGAVVVSFINPFSLLFTM